METLLDGLVRRHIATTELTKLPLPWLLELVFLQGLAAGLFFPDIVGRVRAEQDKEIIDAARASLFFLEGVAS